MDMVLMVPLPRLVCLSAGTRPVFISSGRSLARQITLV